MNNNNIPINGGIQFFEVLSISLQVVNNLKALYIHNTLACILSLLSSTLYNGCGSSLTIKIFEKVRMLFRWHCPSDTVVVKHIV